MSDFGFQCSLHNVAPTQTVRNFPNGSLEHYFQAALCSVTFETDKSVERDVTFQGGITGACMILLYTGKLCQIPLAYLQTQPQHDPTAYLKTPVFRGKVWLWIYGRIRYIILVRLTNSGI